jgi:hypothetical protein
MPDLPHSHDRRQLREPETGVKSVFACRLTRQLYLRRLSCGNRREWADCPRPVVVASAAVPPRKSPDVGCCLSPWQQCWQQQCDQRVGAPVQNAQFQDSYSHPVGVSAAAGSFVTLRSANGRATKAANRLVLSVERRGGGRTWLILLILGAAVINVAMVWVFLVAYLAARDRTKCHLAKANTLGYLGQEPQRPHHQDHPHHRGLVSGDLGHYRAGVQLARTEQPGRTGQRRRSCGS